MRTTEPAEDLDSLEHLQSLETHVRNALENFHDIEWLGTKSPLASSYFLGEQGLRHSDLDMARPRDRGIALQRILREVSLGLDEGAQEGEISRQKFVHLRYFMKKTEFPDNKRKNDIIVEALATSRSTYYRWIKTALPEIIEQISRLLITSLQPSLRLEHPLSSVTTGYETLLGDARDALLAGRTVGILGAGGVGKTTLGVRVSRVVAPHDTFWYTFRLNLNDTLESFLFSLGLFMRLRGSTALWSLIVTSVDQRIGGQMALDSLRYDIEKLDDRNLLLCFDELDLLRPNELVDHARLCSFLEGMRSLVPMLWIGQNTPIEPHHVTRLDGLSIHEITEWLARASSLDMVNEATSLHRYTRGNPRILELLIVAHRIGESVDDLLRNPEQIASADYVLNRIWLRLGETEKTLLCELAVYRAPAPVDAFPASIFELIERRLVDIDETGGVLVATVFRHVIYSELRPAVRRQRHMAAARALAERAIFTESLHHLVMGGAPGIGVGLWYQHHVREIDQGQADTALKVLKDIDEEQLNTNERQQLALLLATLYKLRGDYEAGENQLRRTFWDDPVLSSLSWRLQGDIADLQSDYTRAKSMYEKGMGSVERLLGEYSLFHKNLGWVAIRQRDLNAAWHRAQLAWYEAENLRGYVRDEMRDFPKAEAHFRNALSLARELKHIQGIAKTLDNLAGLLARYGHFDEAQEFWIESEQLFKNVGYVASQAGALVNQAYGHNLAKDYGLAIEKASAALEIFQGLNEEYGIAVARQNLGEAYIGLEKWDEALACIDLVIRFEDIGIIPDAFRAAGLAYLGRGELEKALSMFEQAQIEAGGIGDQYLEAYILRDFGQYYIAAQDLTQARNTLQQAATLFRELGLNYELEQTQRLLAEL